MIEPLREAFRQTVEFLPGELEVMPPDRWNESVLRYHFCRFLAKTHSKIEQFVECGRIDLVLRLPPLVSFAEFKFYAHPRRFDPYDGTPRGFKGGAGTEEPCRVPEVCQSAQRITIQTSSLKVRDSLVCRSD